jgi:hypothetical protein
MIKRRHQAALIVKGFGPAVLHLTIDDPVSFMPERGLSPPGKQAGGGPENKLLGGRQIS